MVLQREGEEREEGLEEGDGVTTGRRENERTDEEGVSNDNEFDIFHPLIF